MTMMRTEFANVVAANKIQLLTNMSKTADDGWCTVAQIVLPWSAIFRRSFTTREALLASSPVVG